MRGRQDVFILTVPLDLRRSLWREVRGCPGQTQRELRAPLNAHNPTGVFKE